MLLINRSIGIALISVAIPIYIGAGTLPTKPLQLTSDFFMDDIGVGI